MHAKVFAVDQIGAITTRSIPPYLVLHASGRVPTTGWTDPQLVPAMYITPPEDGIWDFDFVAAMPTGIVLEVISPVAASLTLPKPKWCRGVRIRATSNAIEHDLFPKTESKFATLGDTFIPIPWASAATDGIDTFPWHLNADCMREAFERTKSIASVTADLNRPLSSLVGTALRVFHEGDLITMDHRPERFNIELEAIGNKVKSVFFG